MDAAAAFPFPPDRPEQVGEIADGCRRLGARSAGAADALRRDVRLLADAWQGPAAIACRAELARASGLARSVSTALHRAAPALERYRAALLDARTRIERLRADYDEELQRQRAELAAAAGAAGSPQLRRLLVEDLRWSHAHELGACHRRYCAVIEELQAQARAVRKELSGCAAEVLPAGATTGSPADAELALASLLPLLAASRRLTGGASAPGGTPPPGTPAGLVRSWWLLLTADEQDRLVTGSPSSVGNLDGLPASVRSAANERVLGDLLASLQRQDQLDDEDRRLLQNCRAVQSEIGAARATTDWITVEPLVVQLLVFDPRAFGGEGRAAISLGDLDVADHIGFLVPGLNSNLRDSLASLVDNAETIAQAGRRLDGSGSTAMVAWMGYDAPGLSNTVGDDAAEEGADLLAADVLGVQASRVVTPHLTVIGHSYGSTTTGTALRDHVTGVDDAVLVGSPGPNVDHVSELNVPSGHVYVGANSRDPVSFLDRFGLDPTHESFGAVRFQAEDISRNSWRLDTDDHSRYFDPKTEALANMVSIVVGRYDLVQVAAYREERAFLPDGISTDPEADREPTVPAR